MADYEHKDQRTDMSDHPDPEEQPRRKEIEELLKQQRAAALKPSTYLKEIESLLAAQAKAEKATHRPQSSPAIHPAIGSWERIAETSSQFPVEIGTPLPPEDQPTPDEPQPVIDFPTGKGGPDENRYAGLTEPGRDLAPPTKEDIDAAVTKVFLKRLQIIERLKHTLKLLCDAQIHRDFAKVATAEESVKELLKTLGEVAQ